MPFKLGSTTVASFRLGQNAVGGIYAGSTSVWSATSAPGVPTSLSGTRGNTQVVLTWSAPASDGGSAITDYVVQYSSNAGSTWTTFSDGTSSSTGATVTGLSNGTAYVFRVAAANAIGTGSYTAASASVTPATTPDAPTSVAGTAGDEEVVLTWSAPASDGGSAITDYAVQYSSDSGSTWTTFTDGVGTTTSATVTGLTNGTGYIFRVRALNALGDGPYGSASGTITPSAITAALLHFDGSNDSTTFTDSSASEMAFTAYGNAKISTAESKFGGASGYFDGSGDYIQSDDNLFNFSSGDWTLEFWMYPTLGGVFQCLFTIEGGINVHLYDDNKIYVNNAIDGAGGFSGGSFGTNQWYHIAISRASGTLRVFSNGAFISSSSTPFGTAITPLKIGGAYSGFFQGYIDELRVVQGTAIYIDEGGFTPPTAPF